MNTITITDLIPLTEDIDKTLVIVYKNMQDYGFITSNDKIIKFIKKIYPDSWNLYCQNLYLLEGKNQKFYLSLIDAGQLITPNGIDIYLNYYLGKTRSWWLKTLKILFLFPLVPLLPLISIIDNKILNSKLTFKQANYFFAICEITSLYLNAGYDVKMNFGTPNEEVTIVNPYKFLKSQFNDKQIRFLKAMGKISNSELIFNKKQASSKLVSNLSRNFDYDIWQTFSPQESSEFDEKVRKYQPFRGYWNQILNEID